MPLAAFDKEDLLYLRDREQEQRRHELHKRDAEAAAFAAARAHAEQQLEQQSVAKLRHQELTLQEAGRWGPQPLGCMQQWACKGSRQSMWGILSLHQRAVHKEVLLLLVSVWKSIAPITELQ